MTHYSNNQSQPKLIEQHQSVAVVGLGLTGYSVVRYLIMHGLDVTVFDSRPKPPCLDELQSNYPDVAFVSGELDESLIGQASLLIVSPGVALSHPVLRDAKKAGIVIVGDIELFIQDNSKPVIAITGSNGKSTVTTLVGEMCQAADLKPFVAGNIGVPALDALTEQFDYDIAVLELSSFQLETTIKVKADAAAILNISADHMDRYDSMGDYVLAKARILAGAQRVVVPRHDEQLQQITLIDKQTLSFDLDEAPTSHDFGVERVSNNRWLMKGDERLIKLRDVPLTGLHNIKNVLAAYALVDRLGLPKDALAQAVRQFKGLSHRMQTVCLNDDITWVNDSKATNVGATSTALLGLEKDVIWIAGGQGKGADFSELRRAIKANIKQLILFGEDAGLIETALHSLLPISRVADLSDAVNNAAMLAKSETIVLFSPACASFDQYQNYQQRGDDFVAQVRRVTQASSAGGRQ